MKVNKEMWAVCELFKCAVIGWWMAAGRSWTTSAICLKGKSIIFSCFHVFFAHSVASWSAIWTWTFFFIFNFKYWLYICCFNRKKAYFPSTSSKLYPTWPDFGELMTHKLPTLNNVPLLFVTELWISVGLTRQPRTRTAAAQSGCVLKSSPDASSNPASDWPASIPPHCLIKSFLLFPG